MYIFVLSLVVSGYASLADNIPAQVQGNAATICEGTCFPHTSSCDRTDDCAYDPQKKEKYENRVLQILGFTKEQTKNAQHDNK
jgi:hypothetical protein